MVNLGTMNWQWASAYGNRNYGQNLSGADQMVAGASSAGVSGTSASAASVPAVQGSLENTAEKGQHSGSLIDISKPSVPQMPEIRRGADPVEMAVRSRIEYVSAGKLTGASGGAGAAALAGGVGASGNAAAAGGKAVNAGGSAGAAGADVNDVLPGVEGAANAEEGKSAADVAEEAVCQTCENRKYQDGSDDPGVSYKMPTKIDPDMAASEVRGHEMEHVVRNQAKAEREGRKVVRQFVMLHNAICPECGKAYVSGGTTTTVTANKPEEQQPQNMAISGAAEGQEGMTA